MTATLNVEAWRGRTIAFALALGLPACGDDGGDDGGADDGSGTAVGTGDDDGVDDDGNPGSSGTPGSSGGPSDSSGAPADSTGTPADDSTGEPAACPVDVCETYGAAVPVAAAAIVDTAAADPEFMDDFAPLVAQGPKAVDAFKASLANFISDAYGCTTGAYTGPTMEAAHAGMGITQEEYDAFIALIAGVLSGAGVPDDHINLCFAPPLVDPDFANTIIGQ